VPTSGNGDDSLLVVIVNYGLSAYIERLLTTGVFNEHQVILVDNASEPERLAVLAEQFGTRLLLLNRNYGFAGAVNRAVTEAGPHQEVLLVNPDLAISQRQLDSLRAARRTHELTGASPVLLNTDGSIQVGTAGGPLTLSAFAAYFLFASHVFGRIRGAFYTRRQLTSGLAPAWLCMACVLLDGDAFRRFGSIPEDEIVYGEDLAWGYRAWTSGATFGVVTELRVVHEQGAAGASDRSISALTRLARRSNGAIGGPLAAACIRLGVALRVLSRRFVSGQRL
jgi:N-acetylglucosaminyl-diphospho-decaprenol L-rhamnosyltransferase